MIKTQKDFVPYQEAMELKELDFDEPCFGLYYRDKTFYPTQCKSQEEYHGQICMAPTFSQCFRFFREKYRLYHNIGMIGYWDEPEFSYIISGTTMSNPAHMWHYEKVKFFEEAELTCLRKLIEIVKNGEHK